MQVSSKKFFTLILLGSMMFSPMALAEETQSPAQEVVVDNSYLTKAHIQTDSEVETQTIIVKKSFLVWVTIRKDKNSNHSTDTSR